MGDTISCSDIQNTLALKILDGAFRQNSLARYYVKPQGYASNINKLLIDSSQPPARQDALEFLGKWVKAKHQPYCALLGEYGMGKTITCILFAHWLLENHEKDPAWPLPIYIDLRNLGDQRNHSHTLGLLAIIEITLKNTLTELKLSAKDIIRWVQEEGAVIIFDGLDEVLVHLSTMAGQQFTRHLLTILPPSSLKKTSAGLLLLTCRTHYFRTLRDQKTHFTAEDRSHIFAKDYQAFVLQPFTDSQIRLYLQQAAKDTDTDKLLSLIKSIHNLSEFTERPYTLSLIPSLIPQIEQWKRENSRITGVTIYRYIVISCLNRDDGKHRFTPDHKLQLLEYLSVALWKSGKRSWNITNLENWLIQFLHTRPTIAGHYGLDNNQNELHYIIDTLKEDLRTATFLVRDGEADFCFSHTSLQEFFLANYLYRALMEERAEDWNIPIVSQETLDFVGQLLTEKDHTPALKALETICHTYRPQISELAFSYLTLAHTKGYPCCSLIGINLDKANLKELSIVGKPDKPLDLHNASFREARMEGSNLRYLNLHNANFSGTKLVNAELIDSNAENACFEKADLRFCMFRDMKMQKALFTHAALHQTRWVRSQLHDSIGLVSPHAGAIFISCEPANQYKQGLVIEPDSHQAPIRKCVFSPDGQYLISASFDGTLKIWDVATGQSLKILHGHEGRVISCAFSPDGHQICSIGDDTHIRIWETTTGECIQKLSGHEDRGRACTFSPNGQLLASASVDQTVRIWDVVTGKCLNILRGHTEGLMDCAFSPNSEQLISSSEDHTLRIWDINTGECVGLLTGHKSWVGGFAFSSDGMQLVSASGDKTIRLWDIAKRECVRILEGHEGRVRKAIFLHDNKQLVSASEDCTLRIWDTTNGECLKTLEGHLGLVNDCMLSPDKTQIASASSDMTMRLWDAISGECVQVIGNIRTLSENLNEKGI